MIWWTIYRNGDRLSSRVVKVPASPEQAAQGGHALAQGVHATRYQIGKLLRGVKSLIDTQNKANAANEVLVTNRIIKFGCFKFQT